MAYILALDVDQTALVDNATAGLQALTYPPPEDDEAALRLVRFLVNPSMLAHVRALRREAPPLAICLMTAKTKLGDALALELQRAPLQLRDPRLRGLHGETYRLEEGVGAANTRDYLLQQTGLPRFWELSLAAWALGVLLELPCAPRVYITRTQTKYLPLVAEDYGVSRVVLMDDMAHVHRSRHFFRTLEEEKRFVYVRTQPFLVEHLSPERAERLLEFLDAHAPWYQRKPVEAVLARARGERLLPWPRVVI